MGTVLWHHTRSVWLVELVSQKERRVSYEETLGVLGSGARSASGGAGIIESVDNRDGGQRSRGSHDGQGIRSGTGDAFQHRSHWGRPGARSGGRDGQVLQQATRAGRCQECRASESGWGRPGARGVVVHQPKPSEQEAVGRRRAGPVCAGDKVPGASIAKTFISSENRKTLAVFLISNLENIFDLAASVPAFLFLIFDHLLCPDIRLAYRF